MATLIKQCYIYIGAVERFIAYTANVDQLDKLYKELDEAGIVWTDKTGIYVDDKNKEAVVAIFAKHNLKITLHDWCKYCKSYEVTVEKIN